MPFAPGRPSWRLRSARALIHAAAAIAPAAERADWLHEWCAELDGRTALLAARDELTPAAEFDLLRRACGGLRHALWLRRQEWTTDMLTQDVRHAVRSLAARPGFTLIASLTLALGLGTATTIFSVVYGVLLRPLPFPEPDRLVQLWESNPLKGWTQETIAPANLEDWIERNHSFESVMYYFGADDKGATTDSFTLSYGEQPERLRGLLVSTTFFDVLGVAPHLGRGFAPDESSAGRHRVIVLSDRVWRGRFGADPDIVGTDVSLDARAYTVVGVAPAGFEFPSPDVDFWAPLAVDPARFWTLRRPHFLRAVARLAPGVTLAQARVDLSAIAADLEREHPDTNTQMSAGLSSVQEWMVGDVRRPLLLLLASVGGLLLIACANVAGLLLVRGADRSRELAVRAALGAGRMRLVRQLLTESTVLALLGGLGGALLARGSLAVFTALAPADLPRLDEVRLDWPVLLAAAVAALGTTLVFGLVPAWRSARVRADALREGGRGPAASRRSRRVFVVSEVALSVVLVVIAGLFIRSFDGLVRVDPGFDAGKALTFAVSLPGVRYDSDAKVTAFFKSLVERLRAEPGVQAAGATSRKPLTGYRWTGDLSIEGKPGLWGRELRHKEATPGYFEAMGIPVLRGRPLAWSDDASSPPVAVINQALAQQFFPGEDPVGRRISYTKPGEPPGWVTIVGVAGNEKQDSLAAAPRPEVFDPLAQNPTSEMTLVVRATAGEPTALVPAARAAVASVDPALAAYDVETMTQVVRGSLSKDRFLTVLVGLFAALAVALASVGLYGLVSFTVTARTQEIGIRMALGAREASVLGLVLQDGLRLVLAGLAIGVLVAVGTTRWLASLLFQVAPTDPVTYVSVAGLFAAVAVMAVAVPARRASRVDPLVALRHE